MALAKSTETVGIQLDNMKVVFVNKDIVIKEDGKEISRSTHRHVKHPDEDISSEDAEVQAVANVVWTDSVKAAWKTFQENSGV